MRNILGGSAAVLALSLLLAGTAVADAPYVESRGGERVYTNSGAAKYRRVIRHDGAAIKNRQSPARPKVFQDLPSGTPSATGPVPNEFAFSTFNSEQRTPRPITYYGWKPDASGRLVRQPVTVDLNALIYKHARANNLDPLLVELIIRHESNFNPQAVSPVGAQGLMQLMPGTAAGLGVRDPFDPDQNVAGGAKYIADQLRRFKDLRCALAAYNAGPGAVMQYGGVPPYAETQYYVGAIYGEYRAGVKARKKTR